MAMNEELLTTAALQMVRLKGRVTAQALAQSVGEEEARLQAVLAAQTEAGVVQAAGAAFRLTPAGRSAVAERIAQERGSVDQAALAALYDEFHHLNSEFKQLVTDWQMRDGAPNDHSDAAYDAQIVARLDDLHQRWLPLLQRIQAQVPRCQPYSSRFERALAQLKAGDGSWFARPIADSYHTVWFELHEDLIGLLGLSREEEALAGRAE